MLFEQILKKVTLVFLVSSTVFICFVFNSETQISSRQRFLMPPIEKQFIEEFGIPNSYATKGPGQSHELNNKNLSTLSTRKPKNRKEKKSSAKKPRKSKSKKKCQKDPEPSMLTAFNDCRLGNQMFLYATLFTIAKTNNRTAYMSPRMASHISKYFKVSMTRLEKSMYDCIDWEVREITRNRDASLKLITNITAPYVLFTGYTESYKYFENYRNQVLKEFQFKDSIQKLAVEKIKKTIQEFGFKPINSTSVTVVGVYVRRGDYVDYSRRFANAELPTLEFYVGGMKYFQEKFEQVIYILASDDIKWCKVNFGPEFQKQKFKVKYLDGISAKGGNDLAVLANCNHTIFGVGTFGFWSAYLSGGEAIFCSDCVTENSRWMDTLLDYRNFVLPEWKGVNRKGKLNDKVAIWTGKYENKTQV